MKTYRFNFLSSLLILTVSCNILNDSGIEESTIAISIQNSETYEYRTGIAGDEDGASILHQAKHFVVSDIVRNAETFWEAVYIYKPKPGFHGTDYVEIELSTGSDGASPPTNVEVVKIIIQVNTGPPN